jgi:hypothetical protein
MLIANNQKIMGDKRNGILSNALSGLALAAMTLGAIAFVWTTFF